MLPLVYKLVENNGPVFVDAILNPELCLSTNTIAEVSHAKIKLHSFAFLLLNALLSRDFCQTLL